MIEFRSVPISLLAFLHSNNTIVLVIVIFAFSLTSFFLSLGKKEILKHSKKRRNFNTIILYPQPLSRKNILLIRVQALQILLFDKNIH